MLRGQRKPARRGKQPPATPPGVGAKCEAPKRADVSGLRPLLRQLTQRQSRATPQSSLQLCLNASACTSNRELLDLFQVAEDPITGKAAIIYTDSTIDSWTQNGVTNELPEIVLTFEQ